MRLVNKVNMPRYLKIEIPGAYSTEYNEYKYEIWTISELSKICKNIHMAVFKNIGQIIWLVCLQSVDDHVMNI